MAIIFEFLFKPLVFFTFLRVSLVWILSMLLFIKRVFIEGLAQRVSETWIFFRYLF